MGIRFSALFAGALLLAGAVPSRAQSLADVARKEEARRQEIKQPAKVYTNKDLSGDASGVSTTPASTADAGDAAKTDKTDKADQSADKTDKPADKKEPVKDQAYWQGRVKDLQSALDRDQTYADALQTRINALTADFVNRDDPAQRAIIERDRQHAVDELDRLKKQIVADKKAIDDLQEAARRAGVPAGWLRP